MRAPTITPVESEGKKAKQRQMKRGQICSANHLSWPGGLGDRDFVDPDLSRRERDGDLSPRGVPAGGVPRFAGGAAAGRGDVRARRRRVLLLSAGVSLTLFPFVSLISLFLSYRKIETE